MAKIFFADDEDEIRNVVSAFLKNEGHEVHAFENGDLLYEEFLKSGCDLVILDIMMPGTDGIGILQKIRLSSNVPVIMLTARDTEADFYNGIALGSDDYLAKPFKPIILMAKINALLRRVRLDSNAENNIIKKELVCGNVVYKEAQHSVFVNGNEIQLTPTELKYLVYMMQHFDEAVDKEVILDEIWGISNEIESRVADETNRRLRKKMTAAGADIYVQTVWGYGFKLTKKESAQQ